MSVPSALVLVAAGFVAGGMNALAGGGAFVTMPVLVGAGLPSVQANATSATALYPGGVASALVYGDGAGPIAGVSPVALGAVSIAGGATGALLLLLTPTTTFDRILPWLLLLATIGYAAGPRAAALMRWTASPRPRAVVSMQFGLCVYGGYFGGAVGIMMLAAWSVAGVHDIVLLQADRTMAVSATNTAAVAIFALTSSVAWSVVVWLLPAALLGGLLGARFGRRLAGSTVRTVTVALAAIVTTLFFVKAYR